MFTAKSGGFVPQKMGDEVMFVCKNCGHSFYAQNMGFLTSVIKAKCPKCNSCNTEKDKRILY